MSLVRIGNISDGRLFQGAHGIAHGEPGLSRMRRNGPIREVTHLGFDISKT